MDGAISSKSVDVVILTYKPDKALCDIIEKLGKQTVPPQKIIIMNTEERYLDELKKKDGRFELFTNTEVHHLAKEDFDHGGTRKKAAGYI